MVEKGSVEKEARVEEENEGSSKKRRPGSRLWGVCRKAGQNAKTCTEAARIDGSYTT
jgi:hypothetical protein